MRRVPFVCTGNIFRSLTAEYALCAPWRPIDLFVASAGTEDFAYGRDRLRGLPSCSGLDGSHRRRTLTAAMLPEPGPVIAMTPSIAPVLEQIRN